MPGREELPSTIARSSEKARRTWVEAHDSAVESYGEGERSHRTAYSALKHSFEKVGDHWEPKKRKGPSDRQAARSTPQRGKTAGGVDENADKQHLYDLAKRLNVQGRSSMTKPELINAIKKANNSQSAKARTRRG